MLVIRKQAILITLDLKAKNAMRNNESYYVMRKDSHYENIKILNVYLPSNIPSECIKPKLATRKKNQQIQYYTRKILV